MPGPQLGVGKERVPAEPIRQVTREAFQEPTVANPVQSDVAESPLRSVARRQDGGPHCAGLRLELQTAAILGTHGPAGTHHEHRRLIANFGVEDAGPLQGRKVERHRRILGP